MYNMRRENLISPWGVGAIVPFPHDETLMVAGLDAWFDDDHPKDNFLIEDDRLSEQLGGKLLVLPPDYRTRRQDSENYDYKIPAVRFPQWQYCPVCGNMEKNGLFSGRRRCPGDIRRRNGRETYCSRQNEDKRPYMIPERFIAVCECGHIEDFPIKEWIHEKSQRPITNNCKIYRSTGGMSSSLAGVKYTCTCGASYTMKSAFSDNALNSIGYTCHGKRPWLGQNSDETCGLPLKVMQRGASNVWFANVYSSIFIPWCQKTITAATRDCIDRGIIRYGTARVNGQIDTDAIRRFADINADANNRVDANQAYTEIVNALSGTNNNHKMSDLEYRKQEFDVLTKDSGTPNDELFVKNLPFSDFNQLNYIKSVSLVHKLRETRAFVGFKRINPDSKHTAAISKADTTWVPAIKNTGEGIMLELNLPLLKQWAQKDNVKRRAGIIDNNLHSAGKNSGEQVNPVYLFLHTFAHCLITALANDAGYSNASIRERIYCPMYMSQQEDMAGILIYTASGDSEGSLGGLVRQGLPGKLEPIIIHALSEARWCAADPVCIQSPGQGQDGCNLAACHNCALLPETSCENKNMLLDRGMLIGTLDDPSIGFFNN